MLHFSTQGIRHIIPCRCHHQPCCTVKDLNSTLCEYEYSEVFAEFFIVGVVLGVIFFYSIY